MANYGGTEVMRVMYIGLKEQPVHKSYLKGSSMKNTDLVCPVLFWIDLILDAKQTENKLNSQKAILKWHDANVCPLSIVCFCHL